MGRIFISVSAGVPINNLKSEVASSFIDIAMEEWQAASLLPAEEFV